MLFWDKETIQTSARYCELKDIVYRVPQKFLSQILWTIFQYSNRMNGKKEFSI